MVPSTRLQRAAPARCWSILLMAAWLSGITTQRGHADDAPTPDTTAQAEETWAIHGQSTYTQQFQPAFRSPYQGPQSLSPAANGRETFDATLYAGVRPWSGAEIWINPETDQGFGLANSFGVAGYVSGEAYKLGQNDPYYRMARAFFRQTIDLGGEIQKVGPDLNQLGGSQTANRVVITVGKYSVVDIFDTNKYAHDPRSDFLNWSVLDAGTFDYAADAWGATYGASAEWYQDWWAARVGLFDMSNVPNSIALSLPLIHQNQFVAELEERHTLWDQPGKLKFLYWLTRANMGTYSDALALAAPTATTPSTDAVRNYRSKYGVVLNLEQQLTPDLERRGGVRFYRHRPDGADWPVNDWRTLGPAGRHRRTRRRGQSDLPQRQELSRGGWPGRDHWRRPAADGWAGADHRDVLQLFGPQLRQNHRRLSVHQQSRVQSAARTGVGFCAQAAYRVLMTETQR
jgi:Carbohydrate-selective porin, OprB family